MTSIATADTMPSARPLKRPLATSRPPLRVLTTLRYFAAAAVVAYHWNWHGLLNLKFVAGITSAGPEAVLFFFVLSGFILNYVYYSSESENSLTVSNREFWKARFARVAPVYYVGLVLSLPIFSYSVFAAHIVTRQDFALGLVTTPLFLQAWWPTVGGLWDPPAWTLSVEAFFYACFPFILVAARRVRPAHFLIATYALVILLTALGPTALRFVGFHDHIYLPILHLPSFLFGVALSSVYLNSSNVYSKVPVVVFWISAVCLFSIFAVRPIVPVWLFFDPILVLLFGTLIFCGSQAGNNLAVLTHPKLCLLGEASYAMYILHMPVLQYWIRIATHLFPHTLRSNFEILISFCAFLAFVTTISIFSYNYLEKPLRRKLLGHTAHKAA